MKPVIGSTEERPDSLDPASEDPARRWVAVFADGWRAPADAEQFADHFEPWLRPEYRFSQPVLRTAVGRQAFREQFARPLFALVSDMRGTIESWGAGQDAVYIEMRVEGRVGRRPVTLRTCDRIILRDGLAADRVAYSDPLPLLIAVAASPRVWSRAVRALVQNVLTRG
jgi:hypothetical protein